MDINNNFKNKLSYIFKNSPVLLGYVFGSQINGTSTEKSDIDFALLFSSKTNKEKRFEYRLKFMSELREIFKKEVEVISLNDCSSLFLQYVIIREGKVIFQKTELDKVNFEFKTLGQYFDFQPFLNAYHKNYVKNHLQ